MGEVWPPHWHAEYAKYPVFITFRPIFALKAKIARPSHWHWQ